MHIERENETSTTYQTSQIIPSITRQSSQEDHTDHTALKDPTEGMATEQCEDLNLEEKEKLKIKIKDQRKI